MRRRSPHANLWIALGILLAALAAVLLLNTTERGSRASLDARFDSRAQLASEFVGQYVHQVAERERRVAHREFVGEVDANRFRGVAREQEFEPSVLLDDKGWLLQMYPANPPLLGTRIGPRYPHLVRALSGKVAVSDVVLSAARSEPIVAVAVPFEANGERRVFSSGFHIRDTPLDTFVGKSVPIPDSAAYVVDGSGTIISSSRSKDVEGRKVAEVAPELEDIGRTASGSLELHGEPSHVVSQPVEGTGWRVVMTVPKAALYRPVRNVTWVQRGLLAVLVGLALVLGLLLLRLLRAEHVLRTKLIELEAANRTLDTFSHTLVHDLRNPLTAIGGLAGTLSMVLKDADERVREMTSHIESSAMRMDGLIGDVLALATVTRSVERTEFDPSEVLRDAADDIDCVELEVGAMPGAVVADRSSVFRSFQNLLANAVRHASDDEGVASVRVFGDETPWSWRFTFEDRGSGVSAEDAKRIFQAFERGSAVRAAGTGLGLSIVAACANAHGGGVSVENAPHGGARFTIELGKSLDDPRTMGGGRERAQA